MAGNKENLLDKLRAQERGERLLGNHTLADNLLAKIAAMENKSLVPVQTSDAAARREVERRWEEMDQTALVDILCDENLARAVRRTMSMAAALPRLKSGRARLIGLTRDLVHVQSTTANTPPIASGDNKHTLYI